MLTKALLVCGIVAGPLYTVVGLAQALTRSGFDISRHALSLLSNGDLGWIQVSNFGVTGLLVIAGAFGMRRAMATGRGRTWGPLLVGTYGMGMVGAAIFTADPAMGFPPGTPADANTISTNGLMHFVCGGVGFLALIAACVVFARRFAGLHQMEVGCLLGIHRRGLLCRFLRHRLGFRQQPDGTWLLDWSDTCLGLDFGRFGSTVE